MSVTIRNPQGKVIFHMTAKTRRGFNRQQLKKLADFRTASRK